MCALAATINLLTVSERPQKMRRVALTNAIMLSTVYLFWRCQPSQVCARWGDIFCTRLICIAAAVTAYARNSIKHIVAGLQRCACGAGELEVRRRHAVMLRYVLQDTCGSARMQAHKACWLRHSRRRTTCLCRWQAGAWSGVPSAARALPAS